MLFLRIQKKKYYCHFLITVIDVFSGISCNDVTALLNTGPVELICQLNFTTFDSVTLLRTNQTIKVEIAKISNGTIISTEIDPNRVIRFQHDVLTIKVLKADCEASGSYYIKVEDAGVTYPSQVELIVYGEFYVRKMRLIKLPVPLYVTIHCVV